MVTFLFSVHTITEVKQYAGRSEGLSQGGGSSSQDIWPDAPWCSTTSGPWPWNINITVSSADGWWKQDSEVVIFYNDVDHLLGRTRDVGWTHIYKQLVARNLFTVSQRRRHTDTQYQQHTQHNVSLCVDQIGRWYYIATHLKQENIGNNSPSYHRARRSQHTTSQHREGSFSLC